MKPKSACPRRTRELLLSLPPYAQELASAGWQFSVVWQDRGFCCRSTKTITLPVWAWDSDRLGYKEYYLAHECAHAFAELGSKHGPKFMEKFMEFCPPEFQPYELEYQPESALAAGIKQPKELL